MKNILIIIGVVALIFFGSKFLNSNSQPKVLQTNQNKEAQEEIKDQSKKEKQKKQSLTIKGSDTELQVVANLVEEFTKINPGSSISVTGGGSGTGIAAIINKEIDIANASRAIKEKELIQAQNKGVNVKEFILARDGLSVIVSPDNKIEKLTIEELGKIYRGDITNWKDLGGDDLPIVLYGRQTTSGTYIFFRDVVVKADYAKTMRSMEGSQAIVDAVKIDKNGIGYVGVGYITSESGNARDDIKLVNISKASNKEAISPLDTQKVKDGKYPLTRPLFQYISGDIEKDSLLYKLIKFESSTKGYEIITKTGFFAPTKEDIAKNQALFK